MFVISATVTLQLSGYGISDVRRQAKESQDEKVKLNYVAENSISRLMLSSFSQSTTASVTVQLLTHTQEQSFNNTQAGD